MQNRLVALILKLLALVSPTAAWCHASEQGFVLLLPTDLYTGAGVAAVVLTLLVVVVMPSKWAKGLFLPIGRPWRTRQRLQVVGSFASFAVFGFIVYAGFSGSRDPLANLLPLWIWTFFWIGFVSFQAIVGDVWRLINPWVAPVLYVRRILGVTGKLRTADWHCSAVALAGFLGLSYLLLADPAPSDPDRLARLVLVYWLIHFVLGVGFGVSWIRRAETLTVILSLYARVGIFFAGRFGAPGWQVVVRRPVSLTLAILSVVLLATGSFDGLNESYWWLNQIDINPFEYPGRSSLIGVTTTGLVVANIGLLLAVGMTIQAGTLLSRAAKPFVDTFRAYAPTLLPIALAYHVAHYLPSFLVDSQYAFVALSDPFLTGADWLGLGEFYVTTGFFNSQGSVRVIYLTQAGAIVIGHMLAVLMAHAIALRIHADQRTAVISQIPLSLFMVVYTLFGLWLLSSPRL